MSVRPNKRRLSVPDMEAILAVTSKLAAPFDLRTMLSEVVSAAKQVLRADRGTVWLYDAAADQLVIEVATGFAPVRIPTSVGLAGACARNRQIINVPDCYADERFNPEVDKRSGYRTRCMLSLPLVDHKDILVGVMQVLNKVDGVFEENDEALATVLAAQCAVALQRVRMTEGLIEGEKMRQELETARVVQMSTLPATMPLVSGYDIYGTFKPAELTGGDTFDLSVLEQGLLAVLADATGHGIAPALSVTQMQAMLRMAFRLGADLETAFMQVNNQLADILADDRFITAFIGLLDASTHRVRFHSGGQGPILHFQAASGTCATYKPTSFPLGAMRLSSLPAATILDMQPGDILLLLSDGIYEYRSAQSEDFGQERVEAIVRDHHRKPAAELAGILLESVQRFAGGARQEDDMTVVLVKREPATMTAHRSFRRSFDSIPDIFALTAEVFASEHIDPALLPSVDLTLEELFTNMVKYSASSAAVRIDLAKVPGGVEVTLTDYDVEPFDVTQAPDADIDLPIEQRKPGGLGLHLIRRLVDCVHYEYSTESRQSRITFRKTQAGASASDRGTVAGSANAHD
ncbi:MAG TPA: SpoIIE family protein phosphatase [Casimicrobiaceae bacterium]|nr:SpoIIE family protein phosphatase [Casimicrobiaceae bacterium]